jgi:hypothetical protein
MKLWKHRLASISTAGFNSANTFHRDGLFSRYTAAAPIAAQVLKLMEFLETEIAHNV